MTSNFNPIEEYLASASSQTRVLQTTTTVTEEVIADLPPVDIRSLTIYPDPFLSKEQI